jgi:3-oxoacyl-[acyl-carrier-protein] synthase-1
MTMALLPEDALPPLDDAVSEDAPGLTTRQQRMVRLAHLALDDLSSKFDKLDDLPLLLAGPETLPGMPSACHQDMINHISKQSGISFDAKYRALLPHGRADGVRALHYAMACVESGIGEYAIVGGVDSHLDLYLLGTLDMEDRVLAEGVMDGFAPGEGAGFLLITSKPESFQDSVKQIQIYPPGLADEPGHRFSQEAYQGDGLAQSFTLAFQQTELPPVKTVLASLNGENFGAKELGVASTRNSDKLASDYMIEHPADCFGDTGAACFPISIGLSAMGFVKDYMKAPILSYASSEAQYRGAACIAIT